MRIYCISLQRASERRTHMESVFSDESIEYIDAVDGVSFRAPDSLDGLSWDSDKRVELVKAGLLFEESKVNPLLVACNLSHVKVLKRFLETDDEACIVLEDDVGPTKELIHAWDIGEGLESFVHFADGQDMMYLCDATRCHSVIRVADSLGSIFSSFTFMAYAITRRGAEVCLKASVPMMWPMDHQFAVCCYPKHKFNKELLPEKLKGMPVVDARAFVFGGPITHSEFADVSYLGHDVNRRIHPAHPEKIRNQVRASKSEKRCKSISDHTRAIRKLAAERVSSKKPL